jgi:hypothetical protein
MKKYACTWFNVEEVMEMATIEGKEITDTDAEDLLEELEDNILTAMEDAGTALITKELKKRF